MATFYWTDELVLLLADYAHHMGWHKFKGQSGVLELFDEVKKQAQGAGYKDIPKWITDHLKKENANNTHS